MRLLRGAMLPVLVCLAAIALILISDADSHPGGEWGQTVLNARDNLDAKFPGIARVSCIGDRRYESWVLSNNRWWTHLFCFGLTTRSNWFTLRYHQMGRTSHTITNLTGVSIYALRGSGL